MKLKWLSKFVWLTLLLSCFASNYVLADQQVFSDVPVTHPQYKAIYSLQKAGVLSGYEDGSFKPERIVTRAEMVKLALKGADILVDEKGELENSFSDVPKDAWYVTYINKAVTEKIVKGYEDGTFAPDRAVNRVEALKMILTAQGVSLPAAGEQIYNDVSVDQWYAPYVRFVHDHALLTVDSDNFERDKGMRRKDIAEILYKLRVIKEAQKIECWSLKMTIGIVLLWLSLIGIGLHILRKQQGNLPVLNYVLAVTLSPISVLYYSFISFDWDFFVREKEKDISYAPSKYERFNYLFRSYVYNRKSKKLGRLILVFLKSNYLHLLHLTLVLSLDYFILLLVLTSFATCNYKAGFPLL